MHYLAVGVGGGIGAMLRYGISLWLSQDSFPYKTMIVNVLGSFFIGLIMGYAHSLDKRVVLFLATGICGGFTTFSTFSLEVLQMMQHQKYHTAFFYVGSTICLCLVAVWCGWIISESL